MAMASSGSTMPERTSSSRSRRAASSTSLSWPVVASTGTSALRVGFLGPLGTFTEQALLTQADLALAELVPIASIGDVLVATEAGQVDLGFVPIENSIEGSVHATIDRLVFNHDLLIQREVVLDVQLCLLAPSGTALDDVKRVVSIPVATAQCHEFLSTELPSVELVAANSTAEAAQMVGDQKPEGTAAIGPP